MNISEIEVLGIENENSQSKRILFAALRKAIGRCRSFFQTKEFGFRVFLLNSRQRLDMICGRKTPVWMVGVANPPKSEVFILSPSVFEKESSHSFDQFSSALTHEVAHLYLYQIYPHAQPRWLTEGVACFVANQENSSSAISSNLLLGDFWDLLASSENWDQWAKKGAYRLCFLWIEFLLKTYGKGGFFGFIKHLDRATVLVGRVGWRKVIQNSFRKSYGFPLAEAEKRFLKILNRRKGDEKI